MRTVIIYSLILVCMFGMSVSAFDGKRKGFTLGIGVGLAPKISTNADSSDTHLNLNTEGGALEILIGYGFDERNILFYHKLTAGEFSYFSGSGDEGLYQGALHSLTYYRYFKKHNKSAFVALGIGRHYQNIKYSYFGTSLTLGFGHELTKLWQGGMYYIRGWSDNNGISSRSQTILITITAVWK